MKKNNGTRTMPGALLTFGVLLMGVCLSPLAARLWGAGETNAGFAELVQPGCRQAQTIAYIRCGHEIIRRLAVPPEWVGMTKDGVRERLEENYRMTGFAPTLIEMSGKFDLFCPQHVVLMLGSDGALGMYSNTYGFEMEKMAELPLPRMDEELRERLVRGMAFDSREALYAYVEEIKGEGLSLTASPGHTARRWTWAPASFCS